MSQNILSRKRAREAAEAQFAEEANKKARQEVVEYTAQHAAQQAAQQSAQQAATVQAATVKVTERLGDLGIDAPAPVDSVMKEGGPPAPLPGTQEERVASPAPAENFDMEEEERKKEDQKRMAEVYKEDERRKRMRAEKKKRMTLRDPARYWVPYPNQPQFLDLLQPIFAPCAISWQALANQTSTCPTGTYGSLLGKTQLVNTRIGFNFGHMFDPCMTLEFRKLIEKGDKVVPQNDKPDEGDDQPKRYQKAIFSWRGGVVTDESEGGKSYQLDSLVGVGHEAATDPRIAKAFPDLEKLDKDELQRVVVMIAKVRNARIESNLDMSHFQQGVGRSQELTDLCQHLWRSDEMRFCVAFLVPKELEMTSTEFLQEGGSFQRLRGDIQARKRQWWPYFDEDGEVDVSIDMPPIHVWMNRALCRYSQEQKEKIRELRKMPEPLPKGYEYPLPEGYASIAREENFQDGACLVIPAAVSAVREHQWIEGERLVLSKKPINFKLMRPFKMERRLAKKPEGPDTRSEEQFRQQRSCYLFGTLDEASKKYVPEPKSGWQVQFEVRGGDGKVILGKDNPTWNVTCEEMNDEERRLTGCDFLLVGMKPAGGIDISTAPELKYVKNRRGIEAKIMPVVNAHPVKCVISACKTFIDPGREDLEHFRIPFCGEYERHKQAPADLTSGPSDSNEAHEMESARQMWKTGLDALRPGLNAAQIKVLEDAFNKVANKALLVLGGPGCGKTKTMVLIVAMFALVGHKIVVHAEENMCLNWFAGMVRDEKELLRAELEKLRERIAEDPTVAYDDDGRFELMDESLSDLKVLRWIPPAYEFKELQTPLDQRDIQKDFETGEHLNEDDMLYNDDRYATLMEEYVLEEARRATWHVDEQDKIDELQRAPHKAQEAQHQANAKVLKTKLDSLREAYARTLRESKQFRYAVETSMSWHVEQLIREVDTLSEPQQEAVRQFVDRREALNGPEVYDRHRRRQLAELLEESSEDLMLMVIDRMDVIVTTYISAAHPILDRHFFPTIAVHEEASETKLGTQLVSLSKESVDAHIFSGDPKQLPPLTIAELYDEFKRYAARSSLDMMLSKGYVPYWLSEQHRMHPSILRFPNKEFYDNRLTTAEKCKKDGPERQLFRKAFLEMYPEVDLSNTEEPGDGLSQYVCVNVPFAIASTTAKSKTLENMVSARAIVKGVKKLREQGVTASQISICCFYKGQTKLLTDLLWKQGLTVRDCVTVDSYQGHDNDFVFIDITATAHDLATLSNSRGVPAEQHYQDISGHVKDRYRLNVALTRAKHGCAVYASFATIANALKRGRKGNQRRSGHWLGDLIDDATVRKLMVQDVTEEDLRSHDLKMTTREGREAEEAAEEKRMLLGWMAENREDAFRRRHIQQEKPEEPRGRITFSGEKQGGMLGGFAPYLRRTVMDRHTRPGAHKPQDPSKAGQKGNAETDLDKTQKRSHGKPKKGKGKPKD